MLREKLKKRKLEKLKKKENSLRKNKEKKLSSKIKNLRELLIQVSFMEVLKMTTSCNLTPSMRDIQNSCKVSSITPRRWLRKSSKLSMKKINTACTLLQKRERRSILIRLRNPKTFNLTLQISTSIIINKSLMRLTNKLTSSKRKCRKLRPKKLRLNINLLSRLSTMPSSTRESMCKLSKSTLMSSTKELRPMSSKSIMKLNKVKKLKLKLNWTLKEFSLKA